MQAKNKIICRMKMRHGQKMIHLNLFYFFKNASYFSKLSSSTFKVNSIICDRKKKKKKKKQLSNFSEAIETDIFSRIPWQILEEVFGDSTKPKF